MTHLANRNQHVPGTTLFRVRLAAASAGFCLLLLACGGGSDKSKSTSYPESDEGLAQLVQDIVDKKMTRANRLAQGLQLDDHAGWFNEHFDSKLAKQLTTDYAKVAQSTDQIAVALKKLAEDGFTKVVVERFDKPEHPASVVYQHLALKKMKNRTALYSVRMVKPDGTRGFHLWSFVYVGGRFRWVGKMTAVTEGPNMDGKHDKHELRVRELKQLPPR